MSDCPDGRTPLLHGLLQRLHAYPEQYVLPPDRDIADMAERMAGLLERMPRGPQDVEDWQRAFLQIAATLRAREEKP